MSRRSLISAEENLIRSQRRGVPNVRMWSEQETPPRVAWDGWEEEPGVVMLELLDPDEYAYFSTSVDAPDAGDAQLWTGDTYTEAGCRWILVVSAYTVQGYTLANGWQVLLEGTHGGMMFSVITRTFYGQGSVPIAVTGSEQHPYNTLDASGFILRGGKYRFDVTPGANVIQSAPGVPVFVPLTAYEGEAKHRLRALIGKGFYAWWVTPGAGHGSAGYLSPATSWLSGYSYNGWFPLDPYFSADWPVGVFQHDTIGAAGLLASQEVHIGLVGLPTDGGGNPDGTPSVPGGPTIPALERSDLMASTLEVLLNQRILQTLTTAGMAVEVLLNQQGVQTLSTAGMTVEVLLQEATV